MVRMHDPLLSELDAWIARQPDPEPSRPEAVRKLLTIALTGQGSLDPARSA